MLEIEGRAAEQFGRILDESSIRETGHAARSNRNMYFDVCEMCGRAHWTSTGSDLKDCPPEAKTGIHVRNPLGDESFQPFVCESCSEAMSRHGIQLVLWMWTVMWNQRRLAEAKTEILEEQVRSLKERIEALEAGRS